MDNKAEKLAAAKKKLKQFQQKGSKTSANVAGQQQQQIQQGENDLSLPVHQLSSESSAEISQIASEIKEIQYDEKNHLDRNRENELLQKIEDLTKEKNDLISSDIKSRDFIGELQFKLNEETNLLEQEREKSIQLEKDILDQRSSREEELKNTVSILIEEKNELAVRYAQSQEKIKILEEERTSQKNEIEDIKASLNLLQSSNAEETSQLITKVAALTKEFNSITEDLTLKNQQCADLSEELKEFQMLHSSQSTELNQRESIIKELNLQIELLNVNMQQLKNAGPPTVDQSLEKMQRENSKLQEEIRDLREQIKKLGTEKDVLAQQYQQYILRLNGQIRTISSQAESLAVEKRNVEATLESKKEEMAELEATIASLKKDQQEPLSANPSHTSTETMIPLTESHNQFAEDVYATEIAMLQKKVNEMNLNNEELAKLAIEKESRIQELEIRIDRIQSELNLATANQDQHEREKLLQAMQSDKFAASRAISQNRQLKMQLEELEKAFIQLSNDKLALTEETQTILRQNKENLDKIQILEPELSHLRLQVEDLAGQRNATIYWKQELEEAHERIQALSHQNAELKKRVIWNLNQAPVRNSRKHRQDHEVDQIDEDNSSHSSCESGEPDWVPNEEHQKLLFHYGQLEQQLKRSMTTVSTLREEKQKLDHLVQQLQSETETIGEYVSLYQVQRGLLRRRAEQLSTERQQLKERIEKLTILLPRLAPQLKKLPQWLQLQPDLNVEHVAESEDIISNPLETTLPGSSAAVQNLDGSLDHVASKIVDVLMEITSCSLPSSEVVSQPDPFQLDQNGHAPHENFHPCQVCSGRLMTV